MAAILSDDIFKYIFLNWNMFKCIYLNDNVWIFDWNVTDVCSQTSNWFYFGTGSDNVLVPIKDMPLSEPMID